MTFGVVVPPAAIGPSHQTLITLELLITCIFGLFLHIRLDNNLGKKEKNHEFTVQFEMIVGLRLLLT